MDFSLPWQASLRKYEQIQTTSQRHHQHNRIRREPIAQHQQQQQYQRVEATNQINQEPIPEHREVDEATTRFEEQNTNQQFIQEPIAEYQQFQQTQEDAIRLGEQLNSMHTRTSRSLMGLEVTNQALMQNYGSQFLIDGTRRSRRSRIF